MARAAAMMLVLLLSATAVAADDDATTTSLYKAVDGWPRGLPSASLEISAVAVDHTIPGKEIFVSQRGENLLQTTGGPVLVFNGDGDLLRSFGNDTVTYNNGTWGVTRPGYRVSEGVPAPPLDLRHVHWQRFGPRLAIREIYYEGWHGDARIRHRPVSAVRVCRGR
eukprot:COSAG05_NODE_82_length_20915_cov_5.306399_14_plen_166_part_00